MSVGVQAPVPITSSAFLNTTSSASSSVQETRSATATATATAALATTVTVSALDSIVDAASTLAPGGGPLSLDKIGTSTIAVDTSRARNPTSCDISFVGALYPEDLTRVTFRGPVDTTALAALEELPVLTPSSLPSATLPLQVVEVTDRIGQGAIWNAFTITLANGTTAVLKVTCVSAYTEAQDEWSESAQVRKYVVKDVQAHLKLDGLRCTPKMLGVWAGMDVEGMEYWALLEEHAGEPVDVATLNVEQKQAILTAYATIHARGVMHSDVKPIHWTLSPERGIQVIDFSHAVNLQALSRDHARMMCLSEMGDVRDGLGIEESGWTTAPYQLEDACGSQSSG